MERISSFSERYAQHWRDWVRVSGGHNFQTGETPIRVASEFKRILGAWQACRPKPLLSSIELQSTLDSVAEPLKLLGEANLRSLHTSGPEPPEAISRLWEIFKSGLCGRGNATEVGITKAILLVTKGKIGPAFDSNVQMELNAWHVVGWKPYYDALAVIADDLVVFEARESAKVEELATRAGRPAEVGRVMDMVLGPR